MLGLAVLTLMSPWLSAELRSESTPENETPWTFVSIPDFLNVDMLYPQPQWEDALSYVLDHRSAQRGRVYRETSL